MPVSGGLNFLQLLQEIGTIGEMGRASKGRKALKKYPWIGMPGYEENYGDLPAEVRAMPEVQRLVQQGLQNALMEEQLNRLREMTPAEAAAVMAGVAKTKAETRTEEETRAPKTTVLQRTGGKLEAETGGIKTDTELKRGLIAPTIRSAEAGADQAEFGAAMAGKQLGAFDDRLAIELAKGMADIGFSKAQATELLSSAAARDAKTPEEVKQIRANVEATIEGIGATWQNIAESQERVKGMASQRGIAEAKAPYERGLLGAQTAADEAMARNLDVRTTDTSMTMPGRIKSEAERANVLAAQAAGLTGAENRAQGLYPLQRRQEAARTTLTEKGVPLELSRQELTNRGLGLGNQAQETANAIGLIGLDEASGYGTIGQQQQNLAREAMGQQYDVGMMNALNTAMGNATMFMRPNQTLHEKVFGGMAKQGPGVAGLAEFYRGMTEPTEKELLAKKLLEEREKKKAGGGVLSRPSAYQGPAAPELNQVDLFNDVYRLQNILGPDAQSIIGLERPTDYMGFLPGKLGLGYSMLRKQLPYKQEVSPLQIRQVVLLSKDRLQEIQNTLLQAKTGAIDLPPETANMLLEQAAEIKDTVMRLIQQTKQPELMREFSGQAAQEVDKYLQGLGAMPTTGR